MAKKYEDFDEPDQDGVASQILSIVTRRKREFAIVSVSAAVILLGLIVWGSGSSSDSNSAQGESVPIVRADSGDYKTTPDNPGGMEIPYRDSTVFSSIQDSKKAPQGGTENILADEGTEEPLPRSQLFAGLNTNGEKPADATTGAVAPAPAPSAMPSSDTLASGASAADAPKGEVEETKETLAKAEPVTPPANDALVKQAIGIEPQPQDLTAKAPTTVASATVPEAGKAASVEPPSKTEEVKTPVQKAEIPKKATEVAKTEPAAGIAAAKGVQPGGYYVQLASVKSTAGAADEYKKLQAKYTALSGVKYRTQEANLGAKGTFYRIQAGPMSKDSASNICSGIKKQSPGSCLVVAK